MERLTLYKDEYALVQGLRGHRPALPDYQDFQRYSRCRDHLRSVFFRHSVSPTSFTALAAGRVVGIVSGRSSYARLGISVEFSQSILQPGHDDTIPMQVKNNLPFPIVIYSGVAIAQAGFVRTVSPAATPYTRDSSAKYRGALEDLRSKYYEDEGYEAIRRDRPPRRVLDWSHTLNVLLLILGWLLVFSWFGTTLEFSNPIMRYAIAGVQWVSLSLLVLIGIVRMVRLAQGK